MIGRTPASIRAIRPLRNGVITDFDVTEQMLRHFLRRAIDRRLAHPRLLLCVPSGMTGVERDAVVEAARSAGAREVYPIEEPIAAAIGAGLPIAEPTGNMVVDIGGGTTEVAVISLGSMAVWKSLRSGGFEMDDAIVAHVKREHGLEIGEGQAEQAKIAIGVPTPCGIGASAGGRRPRPCDWPPAARNPEHWRGATRDPRNGHPYHRGGQGHARADPTRARLRHRRARHHSRGRGSAPPWLCRPVECSDRAPGAHRRRAAHLCGCRRWTLPRRVRRHRPLRPPRRTTKWPNQPPVNASSRLRPRGTSERTARASA